MTFFERHLLRCLVLLILVAGRCLAPAANGKDQGELVFKSLPQAQYHFEGIIGERLRANADQWLLHAPEANPGMIEMFRLRDRKPVPDLVPWAGEFVGKYLISAIQALRMSDMPELKPFVADIVTKLIATQAEDGYLGPFPKETRLKGQWDLWGHYHCMLALLLWHEATGDPNALAACRHAADLICKTFLGSGIRVFDAGSHEMNMAVIHSLGRLYRLTHEERYLQMAKEIEKDWERAGDYLRTGLAGVEFFQTPRPRWESLHDLQGLTELYQITGEPAYKNAFVHHWRSILRWDRRNTGGFSSGEQATGDPYAPTPIETCSTIAWTALTIDMLQLTGDVRAADELELSLFNGVLGAQHPTGRWWTYNTPMDGVREASAHSIVFQARAGSPELNCCSVNGPRGLGMLSEWAVMETKNGLAVNFYGPGSFQGKLPDNTPIGLQIESGYPYSEKVVVRVEPLAARQFTLKLRIPTWSASTSVQINNAEVGNVVPGQYLNLTRRWSGGERITILFDMRFRAVSGDHAAAQRVSLYRGPILLAYDQHLNSFDGQAIPRIHLAELQNATVTIPTVQNSLAPHMTVQAPAENGSAVTLCDFASAGAYGTHYRSWLPVMDAPLPPVVCRWPADGAVVARSPLLFRWVGPSLPERSNSEYQLKLSGTPAFDSALAVVRQIHSNQTLLDLNQVQALPEKRPLYWKVTAVNSGGEIDSAPPISQFVIDGSLAPGTNNIPGKVPEVILSAALRGSINSTNAIANAAAGWKSVAGPDGEAGTAVETDGEHGKILFKTDSFPESDYTLVLSVNIKQMPRNHLGQIISAWASSMNDPLRVCIEGDKLYARIEAGPGSSTPGIRVESNRWYGVVVVKSGGTLALYVDQKLAGQTSAPLFLPSTGREIALGANPLYSGNEFLNAAFAGLRLFSRALTPAEIAGLKIGNGAN